MGALTTIDCVLLTYFFFHPFVQLIALHMDRRIPQRRYFDLRFLTRTMAELSMDHLPLRGATGALKKSMYPRKY
jgi:hypothetical protein